MHSDLTAVFLTVALGGHNAESDCFFAVLPESDINVILIYLCPS